MVKGYIYILSNKIFNTNLLKIGVTKSETIKRKLQLSSSTAIPEEFEIEGSFDFFDITNIEKEIHKELKDFRYKKNKEFFTCDIDTAKYFILKAQINDHKNYIDNLSKINENILNELNSIPNVTEKWKIFFSKLKWKYIENHEPLRLFDIELSIKKFDFNENGKTEVFNSKALLKITNATKFKEVDREVIKSLEGLDFVNNRIFIMLSKPLIELNEVNLGFEYKDQKWKPIRIINYDNKYGLFDEEVTYFDFLNGRFPERKNLLFAERDILSNWK